MLRARSGVFEAWIEAVVWLVYGPSAGEKTSSVVVEDALFCGRDAPLHCGLSPASGEQIDRLL